MCSSVFNSVFGDMESAFEDAAHPLCHLTAPAHFTIDFWGPCIRSDYYHIFFHVCPEKGDVQENTVFFHARSRDLIDWEYLPIPIYPEEEELRMNDGCICFDENNRPIMMYTKVPHDPAIPRSHNYAYGSDDLMHFERAEGNPPFMTLDNHGGPDFDNFWSDPYVFEADNRKFMLISKCVTKAGKAIMPIYEAEDGSMLNWRYRGVFFDNNGEVVNFFRLGTKWVLIYSPYNTIEYFVGSFDVQGYRFIPEYHDVLCYGYHSQNNPVDRGFYASFVYEEAQRTVLSGWISGFGNNELWNGCMAIPRELGIGDDLRINQRPVKAFSKLRENVIIESQTNGEMTFAADANMIDFEIEYDEGFSMKVCDKLEIAAFDDGFSVNGERYFCKMPHDKTARVIIDRSVAEIFFGKGEVTATRCFEVISERPEISIDGYDVKFTCYRLGKCVIDKTIAVSD